MPTPGKPFRARRYSPSGNTRLSAPIIIAIIVVWLNCGCSLNGNGEF